MNVPSGPMLLEPFAHYDPELLCWRTSQECSLLENLTESPPTWPKHGMSSHGHVYALPTSAPPTLGSGRSLLPTPKARDWKGHSPAQMKRNTPDMPAIVEFLNHDSYPPQQQQMDHADPTTPGRDDHDLEQMTLSLFALEPHATTTGEHSPTPSHDGNT